MFSFNKNDEQFMVGFNIDYGVGTLDIHLGFWTVIFFYWYCFRTLKKWLKGDSNE